ncbi:MAG: Myosin heavy chain, striated muscle, partial [Candidatus Levybacteria bacterium GW2011_GWA1_37_16]
MDKDVVPPSAEQQFKNQFGEEKVPGVSIGKHLQEPTEDEKKLAGYYKWEKTGNPDTDANYFAALNEHRAKIIEEPLVIKEASPGEEKTAEGETEIALLRRENEDLKRANEVLERANIELQNEYKALLSRVQELEGKNSDLERQVLALNERVSRLEGMLEPKTSDQPEPADQTTLPAKEADSVPIADGEPKMESVKQPVEAAEKLIDDETAFAQAQAATPKGDHDETAPAPTEKPGSAAAPDKAPAPDNAPTTAPATPETTTPAVSGKMDTSNFGERATEMGKRIKERDFYLEKLPGYKLKLENRLKGFGRAVFKNQKRLMILDENGKPLKKDGKILWHKTNWTNGVPSKELVDALRSEYQRKFPQGVPLTPENPPPSSVTKPEAIVPIAPSGGLKPETPVKEPNPAGTEKKTSDEMIQNASDSLVTNSVQATTPRVGETA